MLIIKTTFIKIHPPARKPTPDKHSPVLLASLHPIHPTSVEFPVSTMDRLLPACCHTYCERLPTSEQSAHNR